MSQRQPAPGTLEAVRLFVNTIDLESNADGIATPEGLHTFFVEHGLLGATDVLDAGAVARADEIREALRSLMESNHGEPVSSDAVRALNQAAARASLSLRLDDAGTMSLEPDGGGADAALGRLLAAVYGAMADGTWERMKACRRGTCRWAFYDRSKNHSSKWCSMDVCGNREKAAAFRKRRGTA